jgi:hypothetical protein
MIKPMIKPVGEADKPGGLGLPPEQATRRVIDHNLCSWLNGTYPKLKTREFNDIDGGAHNPQAKIQWQGNNCDLMLF